MARMGMPLGAPPRRVAKPEQASDQTPTTPTRAAVLQKLDSSRLPPRIILNAVEGWGKTTCGAYAESPGILMAAGETGYATLLSAGRVPAVPCAVLSTWRSVLDTVQAVIEEPDGMQTLVFDALGGFERLCHEHVCKRDFNGDWGERGFISYQRGYDVAVADWLSLLAMLDRGRELRGMSVILLSHCKVRTFKNPLGPDYDRYVSDVHDKTWAVTSKWADAVLFGTFETVVEGGQTGLKPRKGKGIGGSERVLFTERRDAYDAKNRYGMPECISIPNDPTQVYATITQAMKGVSQ